MASAINIKKKATTAPKAAVRKAAPAPATKPPARKKKSAVAASPVTNQPAQTNVSIRMYCIGTGDCFILKFFNTTGRPFTMMIDCGSCRGDKDWFAEYVKDLETYVEKTIDLLVVTHEHTDHVSGFEKWPETFREIDIKEAWFAWTENPADPGGDAAELLKKRTEMKAALGKAITELGDRNTARAKAIGNDPFGMEILAAQDAFQNGLRSLADVNLPTVKPADNATSAQPAFAIDGGELPGMKNIKQILKEKKTTIRYLSPGETVTVTGLDGFRFYVLGPPRSRDFIFKDGKEGTDVYKKSMALNESTLAANAFNIINNKTIDPDDLPFADKYITGPKPGLYEADVMDRYLSANKHKAEDEDWRRIDDDWLMSAGVLALRLDSHINNTSLALAIESVASSKVLLLPGDAEYGSWESWHLIDIWKGKGKGGKNMAEDLLNRTVFYKVGHHLSYNGTALEKGIYMMPGENMVVMATLDRKRISDGWKSTMPNKFLIQEIMHKTGGLFFIMNEAEIDNPPSKTLNPATLNKEVYEEKMRSDGAAFLYKQYTVSV